jgi:pimeloyl-ACP methyl ester carboxylesterase
MCPARTDDVYVTARDGLRLHVREHGERTAPSLPVVCLPGLARTTADFEPLATALAGNPDRPRRVLAIDSRGRGLSDHDRDPANYSIPVELDDVLSVLTARAVPIAVFVGTSRGGLITMALAAVRPAAIAGAVLNDIGPVLEPQGLMRIKSYVGKVPQPRSFEEGADILRRLFSGQFPRLAAADWLGYAQRTWRDEAGRLVLTYDPQIGRALADLDPANPLPTLWPQFDALGRVPVMVIRGANSDLLSPATVTAMQARHPDLTTIEIPDQGHAPLLSEPERIADVSAFVAKCERAAQRHHGESAAQ